jgi:IclR family transcriptional regulator, KDG regulon repressor
MPGHKQEDKNYIAVAGKIFAVIEYLIHARDMEEPATFTGISKELPFSRTTTHRILYTLEKLEFVEKDGASSRYRLATKFLNLTGSAIHFRLRTIAKPTLERLRICHGETASLGRIDGGEIIYLDVHQSPSYLRTVSFVGDRNPVHCTALGKAILAFLPESEINSILDGHPLIRRTPRTITRKTHLLQHLASVRERGIAFDLEENSSDVICVAAPIFNQIGQVIAGCSMSGPKSRMKPKLSVIREDVRATALTITRMLSPLSNSRNPAQKSRA